MMPQRKQPRTEGSKACWLEAYGIPPGQWQMEVKARLERRMVDPSWPDKARVEACISLHTFGYSTDVAITSEGGKPRLLTRGDIARETCMEAGRVRRSLAQLESEGWIERASVSGTEGLKKGDIQIRVFMTPKPAQAVLEPEDAKEEPTASFPEGLPDELLRWMKRYKIHSLPAEKLERAKELAHTVAAAESELLGLLRTKPEQGSAQASSGKRATPVKNPHGYARKAVGIRAISPTPEPHLISVFKETSKEESVGRSVVVTPARPTDALLRSIVETGITERLKDSPSPALLMRIKTALNGHGYDALKVRIHARFDSITGLGMILDLAKDVAASADDPPARSTQKRVSGRDAVKDLAIANLERTGKLL